MATTRSAKASTKRPPAVARNKPKSPARPRRRVTRFDKYICNIVPSRDTDNDWQLVDSIAAGAIGAPAALPTSVDLRAAWWTINNQENTGSCVGWATADGVLRWHMVQAGRITQNQLLSPRHVWMASKETDTITTRPESFIEGAGTTLKAAVDVARKQGVALMADLPFHIQTKMYTGNENTFYANCALRKVAAYFNLHKNVSSWKTWLASGGPVLAAFNVDSSWDNAANNQGNIDTFHPETVRGGHAVCIVGYRDDGRFIVRNSWGTAWGDKGFGYLHPDYIAAAFFDESYGVTL
ncbi:MAG TPA: C1 family peptidase [Ilumatobacteraceae bacterium]|nr:C1 family peptidase [Ilumatobacteraceae bacterium]